MGASVWSLRTVSLSAERMCEATRTTHGNELLPSEVTLLISLLSVHGPVGSHNAIQSSSAVFVFMDVCAGNRCVLLCKEHFWKNTTAQSYVGLDICTDVLPRSLFRRILHNFQPPHL